MDDGEVVSIRRLINLNGARLAALKAHHSFLSFRNLEFGHQFSEDLFYMLYSYINKRTELKR